MLEIATSPALKMASHRGLLQQVGPDIVTRRSHTSVVGPWSNKSRLPWYSDNCFIGLLIGAAFALTDCKQMQ